MPCRLCTWVCTKTMASSRSNRLVVSLCRSNLCCLPTWSCTKAMASGRCNRPVVSLWRDITMCMHVCLKI